jgi:hypothetical protein
MYLGSYPPPIYASIYELINQSIARWHLQARSDSRIGVVDFPPLHA